MIRSWRNSATRKVWEGARPNQYRGLDFGAAIDLLLALNVAKALTDISHDRWRICFEFRKGDAYDVEIVDYHKG